MFKKIMIWLGLRCPKCYGKMYFNEGWNRSECSVCDYEVRYK